MISFTDRVAPRLNIVWQGRWRAGQVEPLRYLYDHELVVVTEGTCTVAFADRSVELGEGRYLIIPPDTLHATTTGERGVMRHCFHFDWLPPRKSVPRGYCRFYPARVERALVTPTPEFVPTEVFQGAWSDGGVVRSLVETVVHRWHSGEPLERETCGAAFQELLIRLVWRAGERVRDVDRAPRLAQEVRDLLGRPEERPQGIQALLRTLGFSYPHLCRLFRRTYGVTPAEYRTAVRLERAKVLLRAGRMSVAEAAYAAGFADPGYFARCFRRQNGVSPSEYRRAV